MILSAMRDQAAARFGDAAFSIVSSDQWCNYLNDAYLEVVGASPDWPFLESTPSTLTFAVGDNVEALPTDVVHVLSVFNVTDTQPLAQIDGHDQYRELYPLGASTPGLVQHFRLFAGNLYVFPFPEHQTCVSLDVLVRPAVLVSSTAPVFPEQYHRMLIRHAMANAYLDDGNPKLYDAHMTAYAGMLDDMKRDLLSTRTPRYPTWDPEIF